MRDRVDRRFALLVGLLLAIASVALDLALAPPDLTSGPSKPPADAIVTTTTTAEGPGGWRGPSADEAAITPARGSAKPATPLAAERPGAPDSA